MLNQRKRKRPKHHEDNEQIAFMTRLNLMVSCGRFSHLKFFKFTAMQSSGKKSKIAAAIEKRRGLKPGIPDILFWWIDEMGDLHTGFIEMKAEYRNDMGVKVKGVLSAAQKEFKTACQNIGHECLHHAVCYNADQAIGVLKEWGIIR